MIRGFVGHAFQRWGLPGLAVSVLFIVVCCWWLLTALAWLVEGVFVAVFALAGLGYLVLLIALVRWLRGRRAAEHLLGYGRQRWR